MTALSAPVATDLERFLEVLWQPGDVREVRIPMGRGTDAGYFDSPAAICSAVKPYDGRENLYITLNPVAPALLARAANRIKPRVRSTTADAQIIERRWLPIDVDPVRPTDISASEEERQAALAVARAVYSYLNGLGWPLPVTVMSGNGYWLLYPLRLPNDEESAALVAGTLAHLADRFNSPSVAIDTTVANASRIATLVGTLKVKGDTTDERPHRRSALVLVPPELVPVERDLLAALCPPPPPKSDRSDTITVRGDRMPAGWVKKLLDDGEITYRQGERGGRIWYQLDRCPFHPDDDQGGDCGVGEDAEGKGLGHCFHNRGAGKGWRDFRDALGLPTPLPYSKPPVSPPRIESQGMDAADLLALDLPPLRWIVPDLVPEGTTILASPPKVGKSCLVYQLAVEASIGGNLLGRRVTPGAVLYLALEDGKRRGQDRLRAALAGRTMPRGRLEVRWDTNKIGHGLEDDVVAWLDGHPDAALVAIDTLGKARPPTSGKQNAYEVDVAHLAQLQSLFRDRTTGLLIVHHTHKERTDDFLTSVSGTYGITGSADTIIVINRKRMEQYGRIHVTGRDVEDASISVRFDGLTWTTAPEVLTEGSFERTAVYSVIEKRGPVFASAIANELGLERTSVQHMVRTMAESGSIVRVPRGYVVAEVHLDDEEASFLPSHSTHSEREWSTGGESTRAGDVPWLRPCREYPRHMSFHRRTPGGWTCDACYPEVIA